jgi:hypothetical protein
LETNFQSFKSFIDSLTIPYRLNKNLFVFENPSLKIFFRTITSLETNSPANAIIIDEDLWVHKKSIVESIIQSKLHKNKTVFARNTKIQSISQKQAIEFLEAHHLLGKATGKYYFGLNYNNELISVAVFGRELKLKNHNTSYELIRYCSKLNINVVGGLSKIIAYFIKQVEPDEIVTFVDKNLSNGESFKKIGFVICNETEPLLFFIEKSNYKRHREQPSEDFYVLKNSGNFKLKMKIES